MDGNREMLLVLAKSLQLSWETTTALLFLGAGSVMHAMGGIIDVRQFGGLRRRLPWTCWTFVIGSLALAGFPFFSGFFSKDEIIHAAFQRHAVFGVLGLLTALLTALLTRRLTWRRILCQSLRVRISFSAIYRNQTASPQNRKSMTAGSKNALRKGLPSARLTDSKVRA